MEKGPKTRLFNCWFLLQKENLILYNKLLRTWFEASIQSWIQLFQYLLLLFPGKIALVVPVDFQIKFIIFLLVFKAL